MRLYLVGGYVRDSIMGRKSNDVDFSVVLDRDEDVGLVSDPFTVMVFLLKKRGFKIFLETPEHLTVRAQFPKITSDLDPNRQYAGLTADFVLARKEGVYSDGRRPDRVEVGTLHDDLARRDFRMNAIAQAEDGVFIDPFYGFDDISMGVIRSVGSAFERLEEDALRAVRALRFSVTLGFRIDKEVEFAMQSGAVLDKVVNNISDERIEQELKKMFAYGTIESLSALNRYPNLTQAMFHGNVKLTSTMKRIKV